MDSEPNLEERLDEAISESWQLLKDRMVNGDIPVENEDAMQHNFAEILEKEGRLRCINEHEGFRVHPEVEEKIKKDKTNEIDLICGFITQEKELWAAIELKHRKESNEAANKGAALIYKDLKTLEEMKNEDRKYQKGYFFMWTNWKKYTKAPDEDTGRADFPVYQGYKYENGTELTTTYKPLKRKIQPYSKIFLNNDYYFNWDNYNGNHFLKIEI